MVRQHCSLRWSEIPEEYTIRVLELAFELHLRERYQNRNIVTFRETAGMMEHGGIGGQEALEVQKKQTEP